MTHKIDYRVYYEDTDAGGVVYHANYLKFAERARTEMLRKMEFLQSDIVKQHGLLFVVRHAAVDFSRPARLDDMISVDTSVSKIGGASLQLIQRMYDNATQVDYAIATIAIVCINSEFKPERLPDAIRLAFNDHIHKED